MKTPYIGVTGFMSRKDVDEVLAAIPEDAQRLFMVGVLVSSKTLKGEIGRWPRRYPAIEKIAQIFPKHPKALNLVHFNTHKPGNLLEQMFEVTKIAGENFHGFQLNIKWPNRRTIHEYKKLHPDKIIVLQCGDIALTEVDHDPVKLALTVSNYENICDYVLIDPSGGLGKPMDPNKILEYLRHLRFASIRNMGMVVAGGLCYSTADELVKPIIKVFPAASFDAEGKVRDANDDLDVAEAKRFMKRMYEIC